MEPLTAFAPATGTADTVPATSTTALPAPQQVAHPLVLNVSIAFAPSKEQEAAALCQVLATAPDSVLQQTVMLNGSVNITGVTLRWAAFAMLLFVDSCFTCP